MERWTGIGWNHRPACVESALAHVLGGQQLNRVAVFCNAACPVVCAATSFHEDTARRALYEEARKPNPIKSLPINDLSGGIGYGELEDILCQINRDSRRVHLMDSFWRRL
jgi:hypothetical protein